MSTQRWPRYWSAAAPASRMRMPSLPRRQPGALPSALALSEERKPCAALPPSRTSRARPTRRGAAPTRECWPGRAGEGGSCPAWLQTCGRCPRRRRCPFLWDQLLCFAPTLRVGPDPWGPASTRRALQRTTRTLFATPPGGAGSCAPPAISASQASGCPALREPMAMRRACPPTGAPAAAQRGRSARWAPLTRSRAQRGRSRRARRMSVRRVPLTRSAAGCSRRWKASPTSSWRLPRRGVARQGLAASSELRVPPLLRSAR